MGGSAAPGTECSPSESNCANPARQNTLRLLLREAYLRRDSRRTSQRLRSFLNQIIKIAFDEWAENGLSSVEPTG